MKIKSIKIKGWRSFSADTGIELNNLKKINLIIGKNNTGKSNLFNCFLHLKSNAESYNKDSTNYDLYHHLNQQLYEHNTWAFKKKDIYGEVIFSDFHDDLLTLLIIDNQLQKIIYVL